MIEWDVKRRKDRDWMCRRRDSLRRFERSRNSKKGIEIRFGIRRCRLLRMNISNESCD